MNLLMSCFFPLFTAMVFACDNAEVTAINQLSSYQSFYLVAAVELSNGSFDLEKLFSVLHFDNPSRGIPVMIGSRNNFSQTIKYYRPCDDSSALDMQTKAWQSPPGASLNGILLGCDLRKRILVKIFVLDNIITTEADEMKYCRRFMEIIEKFSDKIKSCLEDSEIYVSGCLHHSRDVHFSEVAVTVAGALFALMAIVFIISRCFEELIK